jgi:ParB family transcriptional regulator, chromosome partitioning protein
MGAGLNDEPSRKRPRARTSPRGRFPKARTLMSDIQRIPLNKLVESEDNVRRTERKRGIEALAASIAAHGLLQNLTVTARDAGKYAVVAGARRHAALKLLVRQGARAKDWPVPCHVVDGEAAREASLAENIQRVDMNAMDEVEAFAALVDGGASAEDVAQRFGATLRHVEQRLALARLSPRIRAAYRKGELTLDVARAFCLDPDHAAQERVFKGLSKPISSTHAVRSALTQGRTPASDRLALFIGLDAYAQAGGRIVKDLFEDDVVLLEDGDILQRLALEKAEALRAAAAAEGWGWAEINLAGGHIEGCASERLRASQRKLTAKEKRRMTALEAEIERIDGELETLDDGERADALWTEREQLDQKRDDLQETTRIYDRALMALAGVVIGVDRDGKSQMVRGLIRRADLKAIEKLRRQAAASDDEDADNEGGAPVGSGLSKALTRDLTLARTRAIRAGVAGDGHVALALLVCVLSQRSAGNGDLVGPAITSTPRDFGDGEYLQSLKSARAMPETLAECLALDPAKLVACLAVLVAETVDLTHEGVSTSDEQRQRAGDALAAAIDLDMAAHLRPDAEFWARTPKQYALDALAETPGFAELPESARAAKLKTLTKLKKSEFAAAIARAFADSRWAPECLITPMRQGSFAVADPPQAISPTH